MNAGDERGLAAAYGIYTYPLAMRATRCANGETYEFRLMLELVPGQYEPVADSIFRTLKTGDSITAHTAGAFNDIIARIAKKAVGSVEHRADEHTV